jgi:transcriptional regulator with AAA-type ATPase domain
MVADPRIVRCHRGERAQNEYQRRYHIYKGYAYPHHYPGPFLVLECRNSERARCGKIVRVHHRAAERFYFEPEIHSEYSFAGIIGKSFALRRVLEQIAIVAPTDSTVLLHGETGTGKELIARAIHNLSSRHDRPYVRINCAAIPCGLLESELFGHERGAFTGALMQRKGRFELADRGSLFLDEIGDISLELQPKLLRAVKEQEFERVGSSATIHVNVRMIATTHRHLRTMIHEQKFREDLFYRFNVFPIEIPPLRERREDIPLLVNHFVSTLCRRMRKQITSISRQAMEMLTNSPWRGNVRELANFIERAVIVTQGEELEVPTTTLPGSSDAVFAVSSPSTFRQAESSVIVEALRAAAGPNCRPGWRRRTSRAQTYNPAEQDSPPWDHEGTVLRLARVQWGVNHYSSGLPICNSNSRYGCLNQVRSTDLLGQFHHEIACACGQVFQSARNNESAVLQISLFYNARKLVQGRV